MSAWGLVTRASPVDMTMRNWANYFQVGTVNKAYRAIDSYAQLCLLNSIANKHRTVST